MRAGIVPPPEGNLDEGRVFPTPIPINGEIIPTPEGNPDEGWDIPNTRRQSR